MTAQNSNQNRAAYGIAYAVTLALTLYFAKGVKTIHPPHFLVLALALSGLALNGVFWAVFRKRADGEAKGPCSMPVLIFQILQGAVGFAVSHYVFNLDWMVSLAFPLGALTAFAVFFAILSGFGDSVRSILTALLITGGLAVALRLEGVFGGLLFAIALLNGYLLGQKSLCSDPAKAELWGKALFYGSLVAVGRAAIQYYLLESNYASLGVVITHPYTFVALFAGIFLPGIYWLLERDRPVPLALVFVIFGVILPVAMGVFFHVRPMAGYLLGLAVSSVMGGLLFSGSYGLGWLTYLNFGAVTLGLPLFKKLTDLNRVIRLEILGGLFLVTVIFFLILRVSQKEKTS